MRRLERAGLLRQLDLDDLAALAAEVLEVPLLVQVALLSDELRERLADVRLRPLAERRLELERRQVRAREIVREVGRREKELAVVQLHERKYRRRFGSRVRAASGLWRSARLSSNHGLPRS